MTDPGEASDRDRRPSGAAVRVQSARWSLEPLLGLTRTVLGMDLVLLTEVAGGQETVLRLAGSWPQIEAEALLGRSLPVTETFCQRLLAATLPAFVADVAEDPTTAQLGIARGFGVGAWLGARIPTHGARLYVLCCLAHESRPSLGERDVLALQTLAMSVANQLDTSTIGP